MGALPPSPPCPPEEEVGELAALDEGLVGSSPPLPSPPPDVGELDAVDDEVGEPLLVAPPLPLVVAAPSSPHAGRQAADRARSDARRSERVTSERIGRA